MNFYGEFIRAVCKKGRVALPIDFNLREQNIYFYLTPETRIEIHPFSSVEDFDEEELRYVYRAETDKQGRVVVPTEVRSKTLPVPCKVKFVGCRKYIKVELETA